MGCLKIYDFRCQKHRIEFYFNDQKCDQTKVHVQTLLALFSKTNIDTRAKGSFQEVSIENNIFCHQQQNLRHENNNFLTVNTKNYHQRKTFWEIFATFSFSIVLLAAQVNRKIGSVVEFSSRQRIHLCQNVVRHQFCFLFIIVWFFFSFKCCRIFTRNVRIQHKDHNHTTLEVNHCLCEIKNSLSGLIC